ncbi:MAG: 30S ribosomal protein S18 [Christensenellales bacterium]|jgi:small subunit ribosomal protein S18|nr:30S ribosomal protein S18 [Clostridiales bacterium]
MSEDKKQFRPRPVGPRRPRRRVCNFCANHIDEIDYIELAKEINKSSERVGRDGEKRMRYITERGRILPRRMSGVCVKHQRSLAIAIKRARNMALLPFQGE